MRNKRSISQERCQVAIKNRWRNRVVVALLAVITAGLVVGRPVIAQDLPSGTVELSGGSIAVGVGYTWGGGTLLFQGKRYALKVNGLSILQVGAGGYTASGSVYHLTQPSDIGGVYTAVTAGVAVAGGASATAMKNSRGVVIQMAATQAGLNFTLGPKGVTITFQGEQQ